MNATQPADVSSPHDLAGVVLAAGKGTRLAPLTLQKPKALCPVAGVPLLDYALARLALWCGTGPDILAANAFYLADQVREHHQSHHDTPHAYYLNVESKLAGTAGALGGLRDWIDGRDVLLTNADALISGSLNPLLTSRQDDVCSLLTVRTSSESDFGRRRYVGASIIPWSMIKNLTGDYAELYRDVLTPALAAGAVHYADYGGHEIDTGTPAHYLEANMVMSRRDNVIAPDATVEGKIKNCVVWPGSYVGPDEKLSHAIRAGTKERPVTVQVHAAPQDQLHVNSQT